MSVPLAASAPAVKSYIAPNALSVLNSVFGLPGFRGAQQEIVRHVADGGNCLVLMPTGADIERFYNTLIRLVQSSTLATKETSAI